MNDSMSSHIMCELGKTENDTEKSTNIIEDYDTAKIVFTAKYIFTREKFRENKVSELLLETGDYIQNQRRQERE